MKSNANPTTPSTSPTSPPSEVKDKLEGSELLEHALNCVVLIGLAQVDQMKRAKSKNAELLFDLDACIQLLARSIASNNEADEVEALGR